MYVSSDYEKTSPTTNDLWTYSVVDENGEVSSLTSKDGPDARKERAAEYQKNGSYVSFNTDHDQVKNTKIVLDVKNGTVTVGDYVNPGSGAKECHVAESSIASYVFTDANIYNVSDTKDVFEITFQKNQLVDLILDEGEVRTGFVYNDVTYTVIIDEDEGPEIIPGAPTVSGENVSGYEANKDGDAYNVDITVAEGYVPVPH